MKMTRLRKEKREKWLTVDKNTVENLKNSDALALWIRLMGLPDGWMLRDSWLKSELGVGAARLAKAKKYLISLGLWQIIHLRDGLTGRLAGRQILILEEIPDDPFTQAENSSSSPTLLKKEAKSVLDIFGLRIPANLKSLISEEEIIRVATLKKIDSQQVQRLIAEFSAMASRGAILDHKSAFWSLASRQEQGALAHTQIGDTKLPRFQ